MARKLFLAVAVTVAVLALAGCATAYDVGLFPVLETSIDAPGVTRDELWVRANRWAVSAFGMANAVIEFSDKESGVVSGKFTDQLVADWPFWKVVPTTILDLKVEEGRVKARLSLSSVEALNGYGQPMGPADETYFGKNTQAALALSWESMLDDLEKTIKSGSDW